MSNAIETAIIEAATLLIVLPIRIVINNFLGNAINLVIYFPKCFERLLISSNFLSSNENNATSEPENNAENNRRTISKIVR